jgi:hypothetical protein
MKMEDSKKTTIVSGAGAVVTTTVKPGWKTSEFWLTALLAGGTQLLHMAGSLPGPWGWIASAVAVAAYNVSRGLAKH